MEDLDRLIDDGCPNYDDAQVPAPASEVSGRYIKFGLKGFVYEYTCWICGYTYLEETPEVSTPSICHSCYAGGREYERKRSMNKRHKSE
jgi:hypothetical protein